jgi:hypothetical protein
LATLSERVTAKRTNRMGTLFIRFDNLNIDLDFSIV